MRNFKTGRGVLATVVLLGCAASAYSQTFVFSDDPLVATITPIKAIHVTELRTSVDTLRARQALQTFTFADSPLVAGSPIRALHITELRTALNDVYDSLGRARPIYVDPTLTPTVTVANGIHITQIRAAVNAAGRYIVMVGKTGTGNGTVTSSPSGINCGADCTESYLPSTVVTLTATAAMGSTFAGWTGGGCSGTGMCQLTLSADTTVTAAFTLQTFTLTVTKDGTATGTVTSDDAGISCGTTCQHTYPAGTSVIVRASAPSGSYFANWSGSCSSGGACSVTMSSNITVAATFNIFTIDIDTARGTVQMPNKYRTGDWSVGGSQFTNYVLIPPGWTQGGFSNVNFVAVPPGWSVSGGFSGGYIAVPPGWLVGGTADSNFVAYPPGWSPYHVFGYNSIVVPLGPGWSVGGGVSGANAVALPPGWTASDGGAFGTNYVSVPPTPGWSVSGGGGYNNVSLGAGWSASRGSNGPNNVALPATWGAYGGLSYPNVVAVPPGWNVTGSLNSANVVAYPTTAAATLEIAFNDPGWIAWFQALKAGSVMSDSDIADVVIYVLGGGGNSRRWNNNTSLRSWGWQGEAPSGQWP